LINFKNANRSVKQDALYFDWRYKERPNNGHKPVIIWAETAQGEKIGSCSFIPHHFMVDDTVNAVGVLGDISVAKEWRGKGIAQQMFTYFSKTESARKFNFCFVLPNEGAFRPLKKTGWHTISKLDRYVKINNTIYFRRIVPDRLKNICMYAFNLLNSLFYENHVKKKKTFNVELLNEFDERFNGLWQQFEKSGKILALRNKEYLSWRYLKHQSIKYKIFALTDDFKLCGYMVYHLQQEQCFIDDFLIRPGTKYARILLSYFLQYIKKDTSIGIINLKANNTALIDFSLWKFGFIKRKDFQCAMVAPGELSEQKEYLLNEENWLLTAGDKDV